MTFGRFQGYIPGRDWQSLTESRVAFRTRLALFDKIKVTFRTRLAVFDRIKVTFRTRQAVFDRIKGYIPDKTRWEMEIF